MLRPKSPRLAGDRDDEVGDGLVPDIRWAGCFAILTGWMNQRMARNRRTYVFLVATGLPIELKRARYRFGAEDFCLRRGGENVLFISLQEILLIVILARQWTGLSVIRSASSTLWFLIGRLSPPPWRASATGDIPGDEGASISAPQANRAQGVLLL